MHPYQHLKEMKAGSKKAHEMYKRGGSVKHPDEAEDKKLIKKMVKKEDLKASGGAATPRLDKYARGGKTGKKGHHTHINIMVAPKGGDAASAPPMPPPGMGAAPPPAMPPKAPMAPPPGGPMGGPQLGGPMPGMKRGGGISGIANKANIEKWSKRASENTKYAKGGKVPMKAGALTGEGRLDKAKAYGMKPKKS